jgi:hypothetical protein
MARDLLPLDEATERLRPFARHYVGVRPIDVGSIVGTDSRGRDFDREFRARRRDVRERRRRVEEAFPDGNFPPIVVYKLGDVHFVLDGHHRVAIARERRMATIDAEVTELRARWHLRPDADLVELVHAEQERIFMAESGLGDVLPAARIRFSRAVGYVQLMETIQIHGYRLMLDARRALDRGEIARDWYSRVYLPTVEIVQDERLDVVCPEATESDRFLWVYEQRRELSVEHGLQQVDDAARRAIQDIARRRRGVRRLLQRSPTR